MSGKRAPKASSLGPISGLVPMKFMWSAMTIRSPAFPCRLSPPPAASPPRPDPRTTASPGWVRLRVRTNAAASSTRGFHAWNERASVIASCTILQKTTPRAKPGRTERRGHSDSGIGKRLAGSQVGPSADPWTVDQQGHVLARMIGRRGRGIVPVVGGDDEQGLVADRVQDRAERGIDPLQLPGIALDIVPVAEDGVQIDAVRGDEPAVPAARRLRGAGQAVEIVVCVHRFSDPAFGKKVADLADGIDGDPALGERVQDGAPQRFQREVPPPVGPLEGAGLPNEPAGGDPAEGAVPPQPA